LTVPVVVQIIFLFALFRLPGLDQRIQRGKIEEEIAEHDVHVRLLRVVFDSIGITFAFLISRIARASTIFAKCIPLIGGHARIASGIALPEETLIL
jgi:predicted Na+-dependent transporter